MRRGSPECGGHQGRPGRRPPMRLLAAAALALLLPQPGAAQQPEPVWTCNDETNWIGGTPYAQVVIDHENTDSVMSYEAAIDHCKSLCAGGCTGFFYQQHTNTHQICGFYEDPLSGRTQDWHGHREGAVCEVTRLCWEDRHCPDDQYCNRNEDPEEEGSCDADNVVAPWEPDSEEPPAADEQCFEYCLAHGYCCNNHEVGSNQLLSCAQACMVRARGTGREECGQHCAEHAAARNCSRTINGHTYNMCQTCADLGSHCVHGVQEGSGACETGCAQPEEDEECSEECSEEFVDGCVPHQSRARACVRRGDCAESAYEVCRRELDSGDVEQLAAVCTPRCTGTLEMAAMRDGLVSIMPVPPERSGWQNGSSNGSGWRPVGGNAPAEFCSHSDPQTCRMGCPAPRCPRGSCAMRLDDCCAYSCADPAVRFAYVGCFADNAGGRRDLDGLHDDLPRPRGGRQWPTVPESAVACASFCEEAEYEYFGLQWINQCFCGNE
eukprot:SAG22_NODE_1270_length_4942_cov_72.777623_3_plen_494_part_00